VNLSDGGIRDALTKRDRVRRIKYKTPSIEGAVESAVETIPVKSRVDRKPNLARIRRQMENVQLFGMPEEKISYRGRWLVW
jgi:hypothetical protein